MRRSLHVSVCVIAAATVFACLDPRYGAADDVTRCYLGDPSCAADGGAPSPEDASTDAGGMGTDAGGEDAGSPDASSDAGSPEDAGCHPVVLPSFAKTAKFVAGLGTAAERAPTWSAQAQRLCFFSDRGPTGIYCSTWDGTGTPSAPRSQEFLNAFPKGIVADPDLSADGRELYFGVYELDGGVVVRTQLAVASWDPVTEEYGSRGWSTLNVGVSAILLAPGISPDGESLYFSAGTPPYGGDLWVARRLSDGGFGNAEALVQLNSADGEYQPSLHADGRLMLFDRQSPSGQTVWASQRTCEGGWAEPIQVAGPFVTSARGAWGPQDSLLTTSYLSGGSLAEDIIQYEVSGD